MYKKKKQLTSTRGESMHSEGLAERVPTIVIIECLNLCIERYRMFLLWSFCSGQKIAFERVNERRDFEGR